ncbi:YtxH domain-containing protein [Cyanobacterium sp. Dongsha4]|uniref:YtxH domain-containing protein n=1 Tax=Cyanobacterium sp. DS4 TaxID=2878255 RepID=UPI002E809222|nr:YtxH domain-containing protein [Cyanobacterium sp. Dongsha4]WVL00985.1 YtxH domain-containing protein [Cyanobacterium sp. Dongsha4]
MSQEEKNMTFLIGLLLGSSIATIATLLLTPRTGKENRKIIAKTAQALPEMTEDISSTMQNNTLRLSSSVTAKWHNTLERLQVAIAAGIEASRLKDD